MAPFVFKKIEVVYIDEDLSMEEMLALGDALNRKKEIQRMTTHMDDVAGKLVEFYDNKKITDDKFKDPFSTDYIKITGGFKGSEIAKVRIKYNGAFPEVEKTIGGSRLPAVLVDRMKWQDND